MNIGINELLQLVAMKNNKYVDKERPRVEITIKELKELLKLNSVHLDGLGILERKW